MERDRPLAGRGKMRNRTHDVIEKTPPKISEGHWPVERPRNLGRACGRRTRSHSTVVSTGCLGR